MFAHVTLTPFASGFFLKKRKTNTGSFLELKRDPVRVPIVNFKMLRIGAGVPERLLFLSEP
jgi:hypothetical protein